MIKWTDGLVTRMKELIDKDLSTTQIAKVLTREMGFMVTRNTVLGKLNRLGWRTAYSPLNSTRPPPVQRSPVRGSNYSWDEPLIDLMKGLAARGLNSNQICANLPVINGVTPTLRAVRNKLNKLHISTSAMGIGYVPSIRQKTVVKSAPTQPKTDPNFILPDVGEATGENALVLLQPGECKFPINHVGYDDFRFCTAPAMENRPYCQHHWALTHEKRPSRHSIKVNDEGRSYKIPSVGVVPTWKWY